MWQRQAASIEFCSMFLGVDIHEYTTHTHTRTPKNTIYVVISMPREDEEEEEKTFILYGF